MEPFQQRQRPQTTFSEPVKPKFYAEPPPPTSIEFKKPEVTRIIDRPITKQQSLEYLRDELKKIDKQVEARSKEVYKPQTRETTKPSGGRAKAGDFSSERYRNLKEAQKNLPKGTAERFFVTPPKTRFSSRIPRFIKVPIVGTGLDVLNELFFPEPLSDGTRETEIMRRIAEETATRKLPRTHRDRNGEREPFDYTNPNRRPLDNWDLDDPNRNETQTITFDCRVSFQFDTPTNLYSTGGVVNTIGTDTGFSVTVRPHSSKDKYGLYYWNPGFDTVNNSSLQVDGTYWHQKETNPQMELVIGNTTWDFRGGLTVKPFANCVPNPIPAPVITPTPVLTDDPVPEPDLDDPNSDLNDPEPNPIRLRRRRKYPIPGNDKFPSPETNDDPKPGNEDEPTNSPKPDSEKTPSDRPPTTREEEEDMPCEKCRFNPAIIKAIVDAAKTEINNNTDQKTEPIPEETVKKLTVDIDLDVYNEDEDKIEAKPFKVFGVAAVKNSIQLLYAEIAKLRKRKPTLGVPEWWGVRIGADRPQMVIQWADVKPNDKLGSSRWSTSIPHYNRGKAAITLPDYTKGNFFGELTLKDNSKLKINASTQAEAEKMINAMMAMINPAMITQPPQIHYGERKGSALSNKKVRATIAQFYSKGQLDTAADYEIECNK